MGGDCSNVDKEKDVWQLIWFLKTPNSVKHFLWRACKNILPTKINLFNRKVVDSNYALAVLWRRRMFFMLCGVIELPRMCG
jgi:hypothetical protein